MSAAVRQPGHQIARRRRYRASVPGGLERHGRTCSRPPVGAVFRASGRGERTLIHRNAGVPAPESRHETGFRPVSRPGLPAIGPLGQAPAHPACQGRRAQVSHLPGSARGQPRCGRVTPLGGAGEARAMTQSVCRSRPAADYPRRAGRRERSIRRLVRLGRELILRSRRLRGRKGASVRPLRPPSAGLPPQRRGVRAGRRPCWRPSPMDWAVGDSES